jgi:3-hydroxybutyrate dehydrogenase
VICEHVAITGAAGAIGGALARALHGAWPQARLALVDVDRDGVDALAAELGPRATAHAADLRDIDALPELVAAIEREPNRAPLDGLVNCAGVMRVQELATWRWDDARNLLALDLLAPLRLQDIVARGMVERRRGVVVNVASMAGRVPLRGCAYYGAAKAGLAMASEIARAELAKRGVRVVTVYPGPVASALERDARAAWGGGGVLGRVAPTGDPDELARRVLRAIDRDEARVIYPRLYGLGWTAPNFGRWIALRLGPLPVS